ncbi:MAG: hypothetical protein ABFC57_12675 [Veillonellales bacterium]
MENMFNEHAVNLLQANQKALDALMDDKIIPIDQKIQSLSILVNNAQVLKSLD